jgi:hypothetical protein
MQRKYLQEHKIICQRDYLTRREINSRRGKCLQRKQRNTARKHKIICQRDCLTGRETNSSEKFF